MKEYFPEEINSTIMDTTKKFYLTKIGLENLEKEYDSLKKIRMAMTNNEVPKLLESEDLNPEYVSFQEDLERLEDRIVELENIFKNKEMIKPPTGERAGFVSVGAKVLTEVEGEKEEFTIVGTLEADPSLGKISNESPVGVALLGHKPGDEIVISHPKKTIYKIQKVEYEES
jgi:transcription elongation factor GreA